MVTSADIAKLKSLLPKLDAKGQEFANDLISSYVKYGKLTEKPGGGGQAPWVHKLIARAEQPAPASVNVGSFAGVVKLFEEAKSHKLKYPKIKLEALGEPVVLSLAGQKSKNPGWINITDGGPFGDNKWYGNVNPTGSWHPNKSILPDMQTALVRVLTKLGLDPAGVAQKYGKLTGNCCFCGLKLTQENSVAAGFGPICADHYGLTEQWKTAVAKGMAMALDKSLDSQYAAVESFEAKEVKCPECFGDKYITVDGELVACSACNKDDFKVLEEMTAEEAAGLEKKILKYKFTTSPDFQQMEPPMSPYTVLPPLEKWEGGKSLNEILDEANAKAEEEFDILLPDIVKELPKDPCYLCEEKPGTIAKNGLWVCEDCYEVVKGVA